MSPLELGIKGEKDVKEIARYGGAIRLRMTALNFGETRQLVGRIAVVFFVDNIVYVRTHAHAQPEKSDSYKHTFINCLLGR